MSVPVKPFSSRAAVAVERPTAHTGAVTLIQRFGSALNLNIHFHMLFLDGVYTEYTDDARLPKFRWVKAPGPDVNRLCVPCRQLDLMSL